MISASDAFCKTVTGYYTWPRTSRRIGPHTSFCCYSNRKFAPKEFIHERVMGPRSEIDATNKQSERKDSNQITDSEPCQLSSEYFMASNYRMEVKRNLSKSLPNRSFQSRHRKKPRKRMSQSAPALAKKPNENSLPLRINATHWKFVDEVSDDACSLLDRNNDFDSDEILYATGTVAQAKRKKRRRPDTTSSSDLSISRCYYCGSRHSSDTCSSNPTHQYKVLKNDVSLYDTDDSVSFKRHSRRKRILDRNSLPGIGSLEYYVDRDPVRRRSRRWSQEIRYRDSSSFGKERAWLLIS